jgi:hypothetical protein
MGPDLPLSGRILTASYPFAFVLPLAAAAAGWRADGSRRRRLLVAVTYLIALGLTCWVALVLWVPMFELS